MNHKPKSEGATRARAVLVGIPIGSPQPGQMPRM